MKKLSRLSSALGVAALALAAWATGGCSNRPAPLDPMAEGLTAGEKPVAMKGEASFLDGKLAAVATVSRGFDRGMKGGRAGGGDHAAGDRKRGLRSGEDERGVSGITEVYNIGGDSEE